ncbi:hypothetical protein TNCV_2740151 [Trichonephila clavipes]|nr:hypothetical protein TNCV_2740151 [Trichonephila clavipes]
MSESRVRKRARELKDRQINVHDKERSGRLSVITDDGFGPCTIQPDLTPSDFQLFWYFKHSLGGKRFSDNKEGKAVVNSWLSDQASDFFKEGFKV